MAQFFIKYSNTFSDKDKKAISTKIQEAAEKNAQQDKSTNQLASKLVCTLTYYTLIIVLWNLTAFTFS